jgi:hypothetical protein
MMIATMNIYRDVELCTCLTFVRIIIYQAIFISLGKGSHCFYEIKFFSIGLCKSLFMYHGECCELELLSTAILSDVHLKLEDL